MRACVHIFVCGMLSRLCMRARVFVSLCMCVVCCVCVRVHICVCVRARVFVRVLVVRRLKWWASCARVRESVSGRVFEHVTIFLFSVMESLYVCMRMHARAHELQSTYICYRSSHFRVWLRRHPTCNELHYSAQRDWYEFYCEANLHKWRNRQYIHDMYHEGYRLKISLGEEPTHTLKLNIHNKCYRWASHIIISHLISAFFFFLLLRLDEYVHAERINKDRVIGAPLMYAAAREIFKLQTNDNNFFLSKCNVCCGSIALTL